jgi:hypothetical protein
MCFFVSIRLITAFVLGSFSPPQASMHCMVNSDWTNHLPFYILCQINYFNFLLHYSKWFFHLIFNHILRNFFVLFFIFFNLNGIFPLSMWNILHKLFVPSLVYLSTLFQKIFTLNSNFKWFNSSRWIISLNVFKVKEHTCIHHT